MNNPTRNVFEVEGPVALLARSLIEQDSVSLFKTRPQHA